MAIEPDLKDWIWVLERACPECGFDATTITREGLADAFRDNAELWADVLRRPDATTRARADRWSPLEYACHVRDVHRVFGSRLRQLLDTDDPKFDNWDQDQAALADGYARQDPDIVATELVESADETAAAYAGVGADQWDRPGRRSDGAVFTALTIGRYQLHDVTHHLVDVGETPGPR